jgi:hypothetical protein
MENKLLIIQGVELKTELCKAKYELKKYMEFTYDEYENMYHILAPANINNQISNEIDDNEQDIEVV